MNTEKQSPLPHFTWALGVALKTAPVETLLYAVGQMLRRLSPPAALLALRQVVDGLVAGVGPDGLTRPLVTLVGLSVLTQVGAAMANLGDGRMFEKVQPATQELALRHAARLPLARFDDPAIFDLLERNLKETSHRIGQLLWFAIDMISVAFGVISAVVLLAAVSPWVALAALLMVAKVVPRSQACSVRENST